MRNAASIITDYVLEKIDAEPLARRATIYRALAFTAAPNDRKTFEQLADDCDAIDCAHLQLALDFKRRARTRKSRGANGNS